MSIKVLISNLPKVSKLKILSLSTVPLISMIDNTNVTQLDFELQLIARTAKSQLSVVNKFFFEERLLFNFLRSRMSNS